MPEFILPGGVGFCNSVRRLLHSDLEGWAPFEVTFRTNTSCQTDEFLAHRIGLIPFRRVGKGDTMELVHEGPDDVLTSHLSGEAFVPTHDNIAIIRLGPGQAIDATIHFDKRPAGTHARYSYCAAIGMRKIDGDGHHALSFELNDPNLDPVAVMDEALTHLERRVDGALQQLAHQEGPKPRSMC